MSNVLKFKKPRKFEDLSLKEENEIDAVVDLYDSGVLTKDQLCERLKSIRAHIDHLESRRHVVAKIRSLEVVMWTILATSVLLTWLIVR